jgi:uncharacterized membrane protein
MENLIAATAAFVAAHFAMSHPLRAPMVGALKSEGTFRGVYSLIMFALLYWVYVAFKAAPVGANAWAVGEGLWTAAAILMLVASILLAGSFMGNPALAAPGAEKNAAKPARGVFAITRHPMMWSFFLWSVVHAMVAPYPASFVLTAGIAILAIGGSIGQDAKKSALLGDIWRDWMRRTALVPFAGQFSGRIAWSAAWPGRTAILVGIVIWLAATYLHPLAGAPAVPPWTWMGS